MLALHKMMAELYYKKKTGTATREDLKELDMCLEANMNMVWRLSKLENLSLVASMMEDNNWQHEICAEIDKLMDKLYS